MKSIIIPADNHPVLKRKNGHNHVIVLYSSPGAESGEASRAGPVKYCKFLNF
jgi:hypothetical protein